MKESDVPIEGVFVSAKKWEKQKPRAQNKNARKFLTHNKLIKGGLEGQWRVGNSLQRGGLLAAKPHVVATMSRFALFSARQRTSKQVSCTITTTHRAKNHWQNEHRCIALMQLKLNLSEARSVSDVELLLLRVHDHAPAMIITCIS